MLIAAAVCPHPEPLVPAGGGAERGNRAAPRVGASGRRAAPASAPGGPPAELEAVVEACDVAVEDLLDADPGLVVVVGGGRQEREHRLDTAAAPVPGAAPPADRPVLPASLAVGRWLLARAGLVPPPAGAPGEGARSRPGRRPEVVLQTVAAKAPAPACLALGMALAGRSARVGLLVMAEATGRRAERAPGIPDPEAEEYDDEVAEALAAADSRWLARLDPALDGELRVSGRAAWQVLAGAAGGGRFHGRLRCMVAPYGVTYLVASWEGLAEG